jgi:hypothetical protein
VRFEVSTFVKICTVIFRVTTEDGSLNIHSHKSRRFHLMFTNGPQQSESYPCNRPWWPMGLWDVEALTVSRQSAHRWL